MAVAAGGAAYLWTRDDGGTAAPDEPASAEGQDATAPSTTMAPADLCPAQADLCIGVVTSQPTTDPETVQVWGAVEAFADGSGAETTLIESTLAVDHGLHLQRLADDGFHLIVTVGFDLASVTRPAAATYHDIDFVAVGQPPGPGPTNLATVVFLPESAGLLAGQLAATVSETGVVAVILGSDLLPGSILFADGFRAGAEMINPEIEMIISYHPGDLDQAADDPDWAAQATATALANGADVIAEGGTATGAGALIEAAESEGTYCIGAMIDRATFGPTAENCLLSSVVNQLDGALTDLLVAHVDGTFPAGTYTGATELTPFGPFEVPEEALALLPAG
ncbi:MAG: BMP family ABC transporter substrate-binding protein [Actinomycetia bacterium]|nr:BMP family ABC transporter substrate-binding protein [Actinomycetes bacterium]